MGNRFQITKAEVQRLYSEWQKAKHIVVMQDEVSLQFATDVANKVLDDFIQSMVESQAAKKAKAAGQAAPATELSPVPALKKSTIVLTDS